MNVVQRVYAGQAPVVTPSGYTGLHPQHPLYHAVPPHPSCFPVHHSLKGVVHFLDAYQMCCIVLVSASVIGYIHTCGFEKLAA